MQADGEGIVIIYDGECPFCSAYTRLVRLRASVGPVRLVDARSDDPAVAEALAAGYDLDRGMVVKLGPAIYHGDRAMHALALLDMGSGPLNRLIAATFRRPRVARLAYPVLVAGRNATLRLLGRRRIAAPRPGEGAAAE